jgi:membrane protein insertase Oxa1/YidC/SpoIIIJ
LRVKKRDVYFSVPVILLVISFFIGRVNVHGMEASAQQGDVAGVLGHAAVVPVIFSVLMVFWLGGRLLYWLVRK